MPDPKINPNPTVDALLDVIAKDIAERCSAANIAFETLLKIDPSTEDYKKANITFSQNIFIASYLTKIEDVAETQDVKTIENHLRFHAYQQRTFGELGDGKDISVAQAAVAVILEGYIECFFN